MIISLLNKLFFLIFFMSVLNVGSHVVEIIRKLKTDGYQEKYVLSKTQLIFLGLSVSYLLSTIFVGIKI